MALNNYLYPRVNISTTALSHSSVAPLAEDTTVLFAPVITPMGPDKKVTPVHSLSEFVSIFGNLNYETNGQMAMVVYNWLNNGGTVYAYRMAGMSNTQKKGIIKLYDGRGSGDRNPYNGELSTEAGESKYYGEYYNGIYATLTFISMSKTAIESITNKEISFNLEIVKQDLPSKKLITVEKFYRLNLDNYMTRLTGSEYLSLNSEKESDITKYIKAKYEMYKNSNFKTDKTFKLCQILNASDIINGIQPVDTDLLESFWNSTDAGLTEEAKRRNASEVLGNTLETPIDILFDAGYPTKIKIAMAKFIANGAENADSAVRTNLVGIFDSYVLKKKLEVPEYIDLSSLEGFPTTSTNIAVYDQYFTIADNMFTDQNIYVTPTYFLSKLLIHNDLTYGIQFATAGLRRGVIENYISLNKNPIPDEKDDLFRSRINYAEKSSRECAFMSQRTFDGSSEFEYTALSFLNNSRVLEKMKKDLERIGRTYLFEFNDSTTLAQMSNVLNRYVTTWISNRTLASGVVTVAKNEYSDEAVDITLTIRFNGTIEVISVDITIE